MDIDVIIKYQFCVSKRVKSGSQFSQVNKPIARYADFGLF